jgi:AraC-like DNA-binding protein
MYLVPRHTPFWVHAKRLRYARLISLQFCKATLVDLVGSDFHADLPPSPRMAFLDQRLYALAGLLEAECRRAEPTNTLLGTSLSTSLLSLLVGMEASVRPAPISGGLTARQLKAVTGYLENNLSERIDPYALARLAQLSVSHFQRAFKASTGMPPHMWLTHQRIRRAKELLALGDARLAEIALDTGFSDQAHFTRVFGRLMGVTPGAWRRTIADRAFGG